MNARSRADIHDKVRRTYSVLVMLNNNERVAEIPQILERFQKLFIIALVQTDARLIENIQNAH